MIHFQNAFSGNSRPSVIDKAKIPDKTTPLTRFHCFMAVPPLHYIVILLYL